MLPKTAKILLVDDSKLIRSSVKTFLASLGYTNTIEAQDGQEAMMVYNEDRPDFIFMDIVMPHMTGNEALELIRKNDKKIPIVMLTSVEKDSVLQSCQALGITGYILKPLNREEGPQVLLSYLSKDEEVAKEEEAQ